MSSVKAMAWALAIGSLTAWAAEAMDERSVREVCSDGSQADMRACLAKKAADSATNLKQAEGKALAALGKWDEDAKYVSAAKARLDASGKAFAKYRDAQCAFNTALGGGAIGNALDMRRFACVYELNARRAEQLLGGVADLPMR